MTLLLASDHAGFPLKERILAHLRQQGYACEDLGTHSADRVNYVEYGARAAERVSQDPGKCRAILVCGSGIGMSIVANKFRHVRAALCHNAFTAEVSRSHNDANVLTLGARVLDEAAALQIVDIWLRTPFEGGRHRERLETIASIVEDPNFRKIAR